MIEVIGGSDKRLYGKVFEWTTIFYIGLVALVGTWYLIYNDHWWPTYSMGLLGWGLLHLSWIDLFDGHYHTRDFLYPIDEKRVFRNGVFMRRGDQAYMLPNKYGFWLDRDTTKLEKLPVKVYYNAFGKAVDRKVNIHMAQVSQVR